MQAVNSWLKDMVDAHEEEFTYIAVLKNLKINKELTCGNVVIEPAAEEVIERIKNQITTTVDENPHYPTKEEKERLKNRLYNEDLSKLDSSKIASIVNTHVTVKDVDKGLELAVDRFNEVIDLFRFLGLFIFRQNSKRPIGLHGEICIESRFYRVDLIKKMI